MFLGKELCGKAMRSCAFDAPPFGPGFSQAKVAQAAVLRVFFSEFKEDGDDYTLFQLLNADGHVIDQTRVGGY